LCSVAVTLAPPIDRSCSTTSPFNELNARFIELYNASQEAISLNGWALVRYTNANTEAGVRIFFDSQMIEAESVLVIASKPEVFLNRSMDLRLI